LFYANNKYRTTIRVGYRPTRNTRRPFRKQLWQSSFANFEKPKLISNRDGRKGATTIMEAHCLRCNKSYTEYPALSRRDNETNICSRCGSIEAMNDLIPYSRLPIENLFVEKEFHEKIGADYKVWLEWKATIQADSGERV